MFSLFKKKKQPESGFTESVWVSTAAKYEAIQRFAQANSSQPVWLLYHFADTASALEQVLNALNTPCQLIQRMNDAKQPGTASLLPASSIVGQLQSFSGTAQPRILVVEHYPLQARDVELAAALNQLFPGAEIQQYIGLDEPIMALFDSERLMNLLERMGVERNEAISHSMVTKSIGRALTRIAKSATGDAAAKSQQEWFDRNVPPGS